MMEALPLTGIWAVTLISGPGGGRVVGYCIVESVAEAAAAVTRAAFVERQIPG